MPTLVREPNTQPVGQFVTPYKGTWQSLAANMLGPDQLYNSLNVFIRKGKLRDRPGLRLLNATMFNHDIIGGTMVVTPDKKIMLAFSHDTLYRLERDDATWSVDTEGTFTVDDRYIIDLTFLETGSQFVCIIASEGLPLKQWSDGAGVTEITPAGDDLIPLARSVCTAGSRIVALVGNHTVVWSNILTYNAYGALNYNKKPAETNDAGICVKAIGSLDFVVYKERSIYLAKAQAGSDARAFSMQRVQITEGPASLKGVVDVNGYHIYMTASGRIGLFDGSSYVRWIADGLWFALQDDIDPLHTDRVIGVFDYRLHIVIFYYPRLIDRPVYEGQPILLTGMVIINVPLEGSGIPDFACFLGRSRKPISHAYEMRFDRSVNRSIFFTTSTNARQSFMLDETYNRDGDILFDCAIQTGLTPLQDMRHAQVSAEIFLERKDGNGHVNVSCVTSDALENETGLVADMPAEVVNLNFNPVSEYVGFNVPTRFIGLSLTWDSDSTVVYTGAVLYGRVVG